MQTARNQAGTEYKIHKDTPSKVVTLFIYVKGEEGTTFYEDVKGKDHISWNKGCPKQTGESTLP